MLKRVTGFLAALVPALLLGLAAAPTPAAAETSGDWVYSYIYNDDGLIIGSSVDSYTGSDADVTIPASLGGYSVTTIGGLGDKDNIVSVTIPGTVTEIRYGAFNYCSALKTVTLTEGIRSISQDAFFDCAALENVYLPDTLTFIDSGAFSNCKALKAISIPSGVTNIGNWAFYGCSALTSIVIPDSVTCLGEAAFQDCLSLTEVTLPSDLAGLESWTFSNCPALRQISLPASLTAIGLHCFSECSHLTAIEIPAGVTHLSEYAFENCSLLTDVTLHDGLVSIGDGVFKSCPALTDIVIPDTVESLGDSVFEGCQGLTSAHLGDQLSLMGVYAFADCKALTDITLPETLTVIPGHAFSECTGLKSITLPGATTAIGDSAFYDCLRLTAITLPDSVTGIGSEAFCRCAALSTVNLPENLNYAGSYVFGETAFYNQKSNWTEGLLLKDGYVFDAVYPEDFAVIPANVRLIAGCCFDTPLSEIYYAGTPEQWDAVIICDDNSGLSDATVYYGAAAPVCITAQPEDVTITSGKTAVFTVTASKTDCSFQWQYMTPNGSKWNNATATGSKTASLKVPATASRNEYSYRCMVTDVNGRKVYSKEAILRVREPVSITDQPADAVAAVGNEASFCIAAEGDIASFQWQYKTPAGTKWQKATAFGNDSDRMDVPATKGKNGYSYRCVVTGEGGDTVTSDIVVLTVVTPAVITVQPTAVTAYTGSNAVFTVTASGDIKSYQWQYDAGYGWKNATAAGNKTNTLTVPATGGRNGYAYRCVITDQLNNEIISDEVQLIVKVRLAITGQPANVTLAAGGTATFKVACAGEIASFQWQYRVSATGTWKAATATGNKTRTLKVPATANRNGYQYRCVVKDTDGNIVRSKAATLTVTAPASAITGQPANVTAAAGDTAVFQVKTTGTVASYQWQYKTASGSTWANATAAGNKTNTLSVPVTNNRNGYSYRCKVSFSDGKVLTSNAASLTVTQ